MTPGDIEQLKEIIDQAVKKTVNGKIDNLRNIVESHIESDNEWKKTAKPAIDMWSNVNGFGKVIAYMFGILAGVGGIMTGIVELLKLMGKFK